MAEQTSGTGAVVASNTGAPTAGTRTDDDNRRWRS